MNLAAASHLPVGEPAAAPYTASFTWTDRGRLPGTDTVHRVAVSFNARPELASQSFVLDQDRVAGVVVDVDGPGHYAPVRDRDAARALHDAIAASGAVQSAPHADPASRTAIEVKLGSEWQRTDIGTDTLVERRWRYASEDAMPPAMRQALEAVRSFRAEVVDSGA